MQSSSIGIIGGADGPTAIFVTGGISWLAVAAGVVIAAAVIAGAVIFIKNRKNK